MARGAYWRGWIVALALAACCLHASADEGQGIDEKFDASEADSQLEPDLKWNEYDGSLLSARFGFGLLVDYAAYAQSDASKEQLGLYPRGILRDFRLLLKGRFKFLPRVSYTIGYMYDEPNSVWRFRQTGLMIDVPELNGHFFVGRTKEGFSTSKIMVGYAGWTSERAAINDSLLPILADGIKWTANLVGHKFVYNLGWFTNSVAQVKQNYVKNDNQFVGRLVYLPYGDTGSERVLHLAVEGRHGSSLNGSFQFRSKPEVYAAQQYAVDTGSFSANSSNTYGLEAYYRPNSLMFGSEYFLQQNFSPAEGNPLFNGGEIFASYLITGEIKPYNESAGYWEMTSPSRPVFKGGPGAWEAVLRYSYADLTSEGIQGGKFWRLTPVVNWYLTDNARMEFTYGYGVLNRYGIIGGLQFFQYRLQLAL